MNQLEEGRAEIDEVDQKIRELFLKRMSASRKIVEYKKSLGLPIYDSGREAEVLKRNSISIEDEKLRFLYSELLKKIIELSKDYQKLFY